MLQNHPKSFDFFTLHGKIKGDKVYLYHGIVPRVIYGLLGPPPPGLLRHNCYNKVLTRIYWHIRFITFVGESRTNKTFLTFKNWQRWCLKRLTIVCSSTAVDLNFEFPPIRSAAPTTYPQSNFEEVPLLKIWIYENALSGSPTHLQHTSTVDWRTWLEVDIMPKPLMLGSFLFGFVCLFYCLHLRETGHKR